ncbi:uncharacterized protein LOC120647773 [Panicum virgatum]|uniref:uncharacterized protein LOC120647773 n=1 Tax=Panicum virgatum TaxID=38727 RepID=UPI0019D52870|nr:uncharacterized protein LOC120647773 [Panicum virgatum]
MPPHRRIRPLPRRIRRSLGRICALGQRAGGLGPMATPPSWVRGPLAKPPPPPGGCRRAALRWLGDPWPPSRGFGPLAAPPRGLSPRRAPVVGGPWPRRRSLGAVLLSRRHLVVAGGRGCAAARLGGRPSAPIPMRGLYA